ncbi:MAG: DUF4900 domain-containing protein [Candidatus Eisenbacteria bacterium]
MTDDRGSTIVAVIATITSVLLVGVAIFTLGHAEGDLVEYAVDDARAFYVAEGGLERARAWLGSLQEDDPNANPVGMSFENQTLGGGTYAISVIADLSGGSWLPAYEVVCEADVDGVVRSVRAVMVPETFAKYQWFVERGGWRWFLSGERFEGPVHINEDLRIDGDPWFGGRVTAGAGISLRDDSYPTFEQGYELNVGDILLPDISDIDAVVKTAALNGGLHSGVLPHNKGFYHVRLGHPSVGELTYEGLRPKGSGYKTILSPRTVDIASLNGAVWFGDPVAIEGTLDGQLTIVADGDMEIWDDLLYDASTPGAGPDSGCDDVLGLIANGDIVISYTTANRNDCEIHGVLMALNKKLQAENYNSYAPRGDLVVYGGLMAEHSIYLGKYDDGYCVNGYERHYRLDPRLPRMPPPFFPMTGRYIVHSWEEMDPPEA